LFEITVSYNLELYNAADNSRLPKANDSYWALILSRLGESDVLAVAALRQHEVKNEIRLQNIATGAIFNIATACRSDVVYGLEQYASS
jgi:hypothetical protein